MREKFTPKPAVFEQNETEGKSGKTLTTTLLINKPGLIELAITDTKKIEKMDDDNSIKDSISDKIPAQKKV